MKNFLSNTKGNYLLNSKERPTYLRHLVWVVVAFVILFSIPSVVAKMTSFVTIPIYTVSHYIQNGAGTVPVFIRSRMDLMHEITSLKQDISAQEGIRATLSYALDENAELRSLLNASQTPRIAAGVIARPPYTPYDTIILDKGSADGLIQYAPVYHGIEHVIGYVREVYETSALVALFSTAGVETSAYVYGPNIFTHVYGEGGGVLRLSIPQGVLIQKGNVVVLPSIEGGILGEVFDVQSIPTEPEQHAYITFEAPIQSMRIVSVGTRPVQKSSFETALANITDMERELFVVEVPPEYTASSTSATSSSQTGSETP